MKLYIYMYLSAILLTAACKEKSGSKPESNFSIVRKSEQDSIFAQLMALTEHSISPEKANDSLSFLILPLQVSCPSCRDKTIDSIIHYGSRINSRQFIILSAGNGKKTIRTFFTNKNYSIPEIKGQIFIDSIDLAGKFGLYDNNPSIYYTTQGQPYKKVLSLPATIKKDLHVFFKKSLKQE